MFTVRMTSNPSQNTEPAKPIEPKIVKAQASSKTNISNNIIHNYIQPVSIQEKFKNSIKFPKIKIDEKAKNNIVSGAAMGLSASALGVSAYNLSRLADLAQDITKTSISPENTHWWSFLTKPQNDFFILGGTGLLLGGVAALIMSNKISNNVNNIYNNRNRQLR
jgi:hypothetical protein